MVVPGYVFYWMLPPLVAAFVYRRFVRPRSSPTGFVNRHPLLTLIGLGFAFGFMFDLSIELFLIRTDAYQYTQYFGPAIHWKYVVLPVAAICIDATVFATLSALMWEDDSGRSISTRLVQRFRFGSKRPRLAELGVAWAILSISLFTFELPWIGLRLSDNFVNVNGPWRYTEMKTYDPDGRWRNSGEPGPFYDGILSTGNWAERLGPSSPGAK